MSFLVFAQVNRALFKALREEWLWSMGSTHYASGIPEKGPYRVFRHFQHSLGGIAVCPLFVCPSRG